MKKSFILSFFVCLFLTTICFAESKEQDAPFSPQTYQKMLSIGMDVDWCKTQEGMRYYNEQSVIDFKERGISHVRIRIKDDVSENLFATLDKQIHDCIKHGLIPVIAYQADDFKNDPSKENIDKVVAWWKKIAERYQHTSHLLSFDLLIEATDALNKNPDVLNELYEKTVSEIRKTNKHRMIFISPIVRSAPENLKLLKIPSKANGYLMAEWHFYASGPSKTNEKKLWTEGTDAEKDIILNKIKEALAFQRDTGILTWVGAVMPGDYNVDNAYSVNEQVVFISFVKQALSEHNIPFAINSDVKFYDRTTNSFIPSHRPILDALYTQTKGK